jgi:hypothetical protein
MCLSVLTRAHYLSLKKLADFFHDGGAEEVSYWKRKPPPRRYKKPIFWIERIMVGHLVTGRQFELISERGRLKSPIPFESVRPSSNFTASEIECPITAFACESHDLPKHKHIRAKATRSYRAADV